MFLPYTWQIVKFFFFFQLPVEEQEMNRCKHFQ